MAKDSYSIDFNGVPVDVPAWATREQLDKLIDLDAGQLKALTAMLRDNKIHTNRAIRANEGLLRDLGHTVDAAEKKRSSDADKARKQASAEHKKHIAEIKEAKKKQKENEEKLYKNLEAASKHLQDAGKNFVVGFSGGNLKGMAMALGSVVGLGAAAGAAVGVLEGFSKGIIQLSNAGAGLSGDLMGVRFAAADAGLDMEKFGKIVVENGAAVRALGTSTNEGMYAFSALSKSLRQGAQQFNQFGLTNTEYNEILAEEIEIRRQGGLTQAQITDEVQSSMNNLLKETTAMANITGQDRRELLRRRQAQMQEAATAAKLLAMQREGVDTGPIREMIGAVTDTLGKGSSEMSNAFVNAALNGMDFTQVNQGMFAAISQMGGEDVAGEFRNIFNEVSAAFADPTTDVEAFKIRMAELVGQLSQAGDGEAFEVLGKISARGGKFANEADQLIQMFQNLGNMEVSGETIQKNFDQTVEGLETQALLALPSALEDLANNVKASALDTILDVLGANVTDAGQGLVTAIREVSNNFGPGTGLGEGLMQTFEELPPAMQKLTIAIAALTAAIIGGQLIGGAINLGKGIGGAFSGAKRGLRKANIGRKRLGRTLSRINPFSSAGRSNITGAVTGAADRVKTAGSLVVDGAKDAGKLAAQAGSKVVDAGKVAAQAGKEAAEKAAEVAAKSAGGQAAATAAKAVVAEGAEAVAKASGKSLLKKIPIVGLVAGGAFALERAFRGDWLGASMELASGAASTIPVAGTAASVGIDAALLARDLGVFDGDEVDMAALKQQADAAQSDLANPDIRGRMTDEERTRAEQIVSLYEQMSAEQESLKAEQASVAEAQKAHMEEGRQLAIAAIQDQITKEQERIERSNAGVNEYWGRETKGREQSMETIVELEKRLQALKDQMPNASAQSGEPVSESSTMTGSVNWMQFMQKDAEAFGKFDKRMGELIEQGMDKDEAKMQATREFASVINDLGVGNITVDGNKPTNKTTSTEPKSSEPAVPSSTILDVQRSQAKALQTSTEALAKFESESGDKVKIGERFDPIEGYNVDVMGYADAGKQAEYEALRNDKFAKERALNKTEDDKRYQLARATELAAQMGIDTSTENGSQISFSSVGGVPTTINGQAVDRSLLTEREKIDIAAHEQAYSEMNRQRPQPNSGSRDNETNQAILRELQENNRLLRKQTGAIEAGQ